jgi:hypothetical protein
LIGAARSSRASLTCDEEVAGEGERGAGGDSEALEGADERLRALEEGGVQRDPALGEALPPGRGWIEGQLLGVEPGTEAVAGTAQQDRADAVVPLELLDAGEKRLDQRTGDGVLALGTVQHELAPAAVPLHEHRSRGGHCR